MAPAVGDEDGRTNSLKRFSTGQQVECSSGVASRANPRPSGSVGGGGGPPNCDTRLMKRPRLVEDDGESDGTDSDDEKPLAKLKRISTGDAKKEDDDGHSKPALGAQKIKEEEYDDHNKPAVSTQKIKEEEDDDHNKPAVSTRKIDSANLASDKTVLARTASVKSERDDDSEDEKPLAMRTRRLTSNASSASRNSIKRRPGDSNIGTSSPFKKVKPSAIQREPKAADAHDNIIPRAPRLTSVEPSKTKPPAKNTTKNKKKSPSSFTKDSQKTVQMKAKKAVRNSWLSKATKVRQGSGSGKKWSTLEHNGVMFPPPYKPHGVKMLYNGQPVDLTSEQEEVATMFAVMRDTEYVSKETFINNFFTDWRKLLGKTHIIKKFELCDFTPIYEWHLREKEKKKQMTTEEKKALRDEKGKQEEKYLWAIVDGVKEKVGNFRVEPPGLFRGRGEHPKMGRLKRRIRPNDITINIGKGTPVPVCPVPGESWKEVKHDNTVTWLAFWNDPINQKDFKYVFLAASSSLKGQSDKEKYEKARKLKDHIDNIRVNYTKDFRSKDQVKKQIAVATYLVDKLALRAGNEKDEDEADTVGCCTLKVENVTCLPPNKLQFDFLGKDSIRYLNTVEVELPVYEAVKEFCAGKNKGDNVFGEIDTIKLNAHLKELMPGLTAKVFRTYNASVTLDAILNKETEDGTLLQKISIYKRANKEVAIICNHQRAVSKSHDSQMAKLNEKIDELKAQRDGLKEELEKAKKGKRLGDDKDGKQKKKLTAEMLESKISGIETKIEGMVITKNSTEESKTVALGTSKINYLDPRITVAWCKTHEIPISKIFSKTILEKFGWAMDVGPDFRF